jgi:hypothetical protein
MTDARARIALVTRSWGGDDDAPSITRLIAGAFAIHGEVEIVHVCETETPSVANESVFVVHKVPLIGAQPVRAAIALAATEIGGYGDLPEAVIGLLERWEGTAPSAPDVLRSIAPDVVVLVGPSHPFDVASIGVFGSRSPRVVFIPMTGRSGIPESERFGALIDTADVVVSVHPGEHRDLALRFGDPNAIVPLDVALPLNRNATDQGLFGVGWFGPYVVLIRRFPADGGRYVHSVTHDVMRGALGKVAVAEVDGTRWRISDDENTAELPVNPTRVNLWRLMANATTTIDLRPPDLFGREAIESMMLGTPVIVPEGSAAMEHVAVANGGLWYRNFGEVLDTARVLRDEQTRAWLGAQGRVYAESHHGDMDGFVARIGALAGL